MKTFAMYACGVSLALMLTGCHTTTASRTPGSATSLESATNIESVATRLDGDATSLESATTNPGGNAALNKSAGNLERAPLAPTAEPSQLSLAALNVSDRVLNEYNQKAGDGYWCRYASAALNDAQAKLHPELQASLRTLNATLANDAQVWISECQQDLKERRARRGNQPAFTPILYYTSDLSCSRADARFLSLAQNSYAFVGGMHGMNQTRAFNFEVNSGRLLKLSDIIANDDAFRKAVVEELIGKYGDTLDKDVAKDVDSIFDDSAKGEYHWRLTPGGIGVYFDYYEVACYAAGPRYVEVSFQAHPELFNDKYGAECFAITAQDERFSQMNEDKIAGVLLRDAIYAQHSGLWKLSDCRQNGKYVPASGLGMQGSLYIDVDATVSIKVDGGGNSFVEKSVPMGTEELSKDAPFPAEKGWTFLGKYSDCHAYLNPEGEMEVQVTQHKNGKPVRTMQLKFVR